ncbi:glycosyl hydrolase family 61-domain-containing protein [Paraphysoderma sedebokerense]|nr:glycosyl hydrolase family 61-domain-containing protein [Paraphysoderma sedebokerense]
MELKLSIFLPLLVIIQSITIHGHTYLHSFTSGGQESTQCIRAHPAQKNFPIKDIAGNEMMCNAGTQPAQSACGVTDGSEVTFQFFHEGPSAGDQIIDKSHVGPCTVYLSKADGSGNPTGWFKIFEKGFSGGQWCTDELIAARGKLNVKLPSGLENGRYVFRTEIIALHEADAKFNENPGRGAQLYVNCGDMTVQGGSGSLRPATIAIPSPQWATFDSPGIHFNPYNTPGTSYIVPGPPLLASSASSNAGSSGSGNVSPAPKADPGAGKSTVGNGGAGPKSESGPANSPKAAVGTEMACRVTSVDGSQLNMACQPKA